MQSQQVSKAIALAEFYIEFETQAGNEQVANIYQEFRDFTRFSNAVPSELPDIGLIYMRLTEYLDGDTQSIKDFASALAEICELEAEGVDWKQVVNEASEMLANVAIGNLLKKKLLH